jgi:agmatinase
MVAGVINHEPPETADAVVISAPYDHGASFGGGAARGPAAILACLERQIELFERHTRTEPACGYRIAHRRLDDLEDLAPAAMVGTVAQAIAATRPFALLLGGIHSVTIGALEAHAAATRADQVTVLQIDAHLDLRDDDSDYNDDEPSRYAHSCVMRRAHDLGFRSCAVGIRAYSKDEHAFATANSLPIFEWGRGPEPSVESVLAAIPTERVYLTLDVDGFDPAIMPATGTPVPGGLAWAYGCRLLREVFLAKEVIGADIVEVAPIAGQPLTEYAAAQLAYDILSYQLLKQDGKLAFA